MSASRLLVVLLVQMATVAAATNLSATFISTVIPTQIIDAAADTDPCDWGDKHACGVLLNCSNVDRADCARAVADGGCGDSCGENTVCKDGECVPDCVEEISSCCSPQAGPGCVLQFVNDCVKQFDSYCTDSKWDEQCVQEARMECNLYCGPPLTFQRVTDDVVESQDEFVAKLFNLLSLPDGQQPISDYIFPEEEEDTITRGGGDGGCFTSGYKGCPKGYQCYSSRRGYFCSWPLCPNTDGTQVIGGNSYCLCPSSLYSNVCAAGGYCNAGECIGPPAITDTCSRTQACAQDGMYCNYYTGTCYWPGNPCTSQPGYPVNPAYPCSQTCYDDGNCPVRQKCDSERHHCYQPTAGGGGNIDNGICQATGVATNTCSSIATYGYGDYIGTIYSYCLCNRYGYAGTTSCASLWWNQPSQRRGGGGSVQSDNQKACKEVLTKVSTYCCPNHDPDQYFIFNEMCSTLPECSQ